MLPSSSFPRVCEEHQDREVRRGDLPHGVLGGGFRSGRRRFISVVFFLSFLLRSRSLRFLKIRWLQGTATAKVLELSAMDYSEPGANTNPRAGSFWGGPLPGHRPPPHFVH